MVDMNDERTGKIAEVLSNKTCKRVLEVISESEEVSAGDIVSKLKMPPNTVDYNLKKLIAAGLIEENKSFFWSVKGKKIKTYKAANKKIIISTKPKFAGVIASALLFGVIGFSAKLFGNMAGLFGSTYSGNTFVNSASDNLVSKISAGGASSLNLVAPSASEGVSNLTLNNSINFSSFFSNTWVWFIFGALIGVIIFILYKQMKGGSKI